MIDHFADNAALCARRQFPKGRARAQKAAPEYSETLRREAQALAIGYAARRALQALAIAAGLVVVPLGANALARFVSYTLPGWAL